MSSNELDIIGIVREAGSILRRDGDASEALLWVCKLLEERVPHYDWVGFYIADPVDRTLHLGPFVGAPTEHVLIPFGRGICGQAAETKRSFVVQDVAKEDNYLSCSGSVRSEVVLPIMDGDTILGELDIDSHDLSPFTDLDHDLLEKVCALCAPLVARLRDSFR